jgi:hypothetical protein
MGRAIKSISDVVNGKYSPSWRCQSRPARADRSGRCSSTVSPWTRCPVFRPGGLGWSYLRWFGCCSYAKAEFPPKPHCLSHCLRSDWDFGPPRGEAPIRPLSCSPNPVGACKRVYARRTRFGHQTNCLVTHRVARASRHAPPNTRSQRKSLRSTKVPFRDVVD